MSASAPEGPLTALAAAGRVIADPLRFKQRLRIGEDAYLLRRLAKAGTSLWETAGAAMTGAGVASSATVAGTFFAPTGLMASLGLAGAAVTPVGWVVAAAALAGGGYYGVSRWWAARPDTMVDVVPRFISTPLDVLGVALADLIGGLGLRVAAADGEIAPAELAHIRDHLVLDWGYDRAFAEAALALIAADLGGQGLASSSESVARFLAANPDCNERAVRAELLAFLRELVAADGRIAPGEQDALLLIETVWAREGAWSAAGALASARGAAADVGTAAAKAVDAARGLGRRWGA